MFFGRFLHGLIRNRQGCTEIRYHSIPISGACVFMIIKFRAKAHLRWALMGLTKKVTFENANQIVICLSAFYITFVSGLKPLLIFRFNPGLKAGVNGDHLGWALALN